jgi:hypothetical protein
MWGRLEASLLHAWGLPNRFRAELFAGHKQGRQDACPSPLALLSAVLAQEVQ